MNYFIDGIKNLRLELKISYGISIFLIFIVIMQSIITMNLSNAKNKTYRISLPPNLEFGAVVKTGDISKFDIYKFAGYLEQQLHFWSKDGEEDFKNNINKLYPFITPEYRDYLLKKYINLLNLGQLSNREKSLQPLNSFDEKLVKKIDKNTWLVTLDFAVQEHINNKRFKNFKHRSFIKVVARDINPEINPWGLQLDVPFAEPKRLKTVNKK